MSEPTNPDRGYEWGVMYHGPALCELHRGPMSEQDARYWLHGAERDGLIVERFRLVRRPFGEWEEVTR